MGIHLHPGKTHGLFPQTEPDMLTHIRRTHWCHAATRQALSVTRTPSPQQVPELMGVIGVTNTPKRVKAFSTFDIPNDAGLQPGECLAGIAGCTTPQRQIRELVKRHESKKFASNSRSYGSSSCSQVLECSSNTLYTI